MITQRRLTGRNVIILSCDDWASGLKTARHHLTSRLARHNRVLFVNSVGQRAPSAAGRDVKRVLSKLAAFFRGAVEVPEGFHVYTPIVFPFFRRNALVRAVNGMVLRLGIRRLISRLSLTDPIVFVFNASFNDVVGKLG